MRFGKRPFIFALATVTIVASCLPGGPLPGFAETAVAGPPPIARTPTRFGRRAVRHPGLANPGFGVAPFWYPAGHVVLYPYGPYARGYLAPMPPGPYSYHGYSATAFQLYGFPPGVTLPPHAPRTVEPQVSESPAEKGLVVEPQPEPVPEPIPAPPPDES
jgi:hypothetical protein